MTNRIASQANIGSQDFLSSVRSIFCCMLFVIQIAVWGADGVITVSPIVGQLGD